jgi:hypothetical protein
MYAPLFPFVIPRLTVLSAIERTPEEPSLFPIELSVKLGDQEIFKGSIALNFAQQHLTRTILDIGGLLISVPGTLNFLLTREDQELASWAVLIERLNAPSMEQLPFPAGPT